MNQTRKTAKLRESELRSALLRIKRERSKLGEIKITVAAVAREAGVSAALIYNHYPDIAELIRETQGRSSREQRDNKNTELKGEREKNRLLRAEVQQLMVKISKLASINETLRMDNDMLRSKSNAENVIDFSKT